MGTIAMWITAANNDLAKERVQSFRSHNKKNVEECSVADGKTVEGQQKCQGSQNAGIEELEGLYCKRVLQCNTRDVCRATINEPKQTK